MQLTTYTLSYFDGDAHDSPPGPRARPLAIRQEEVVGHEEL